MSPYSFSKPKIRLLKGLGCNMLMQTEYQSPLPSSTEGHDPSMNEKSRQRKNTGGHDGIRESRVWHTRRTFPQPAQKGCQQGRRRVETAGGTTCTSCGPFAPTMDLGERIGASSSSCLRDTFCHVEDFDELRTKPGKRRVSARRGWG